MNEAPSEDRLAFPVQVINWSSPPGNPAGFPVDVLFSAFSNPDRVTAISWIAPCSSISTPRSTTAASAISSCGPGSPRGPRPGLRRLSFIASVIVPYPALIAFLRQGCRIAIRSAGLGCFANLANGWPRLPGSRPRTSLSGFISYPATTPHTFAALQSQFSGVRAWLNHAGFSATTTIGTRSLSASS